MICGKAGGRLLRIVAWGAMGTVLPGCGSTADTTAPDDTDELNVRYTMLATEFLPHSQLPPSLLLIMSIENPSTESVIKTYPAGCPVRMRIYRLLDNQLMYDETKLPCPFDAPVTLRVLPGQIRSIGSGFRQMTQIMGDSIPCGAYRLVGVPGMEGTRSVEIESGETVLRAYPGWPTSNPDAVFQC